MPTQNFMVFNSPLPPQSETKPEKTDLKPDSSSSMASSTAPSSHNNSLLHHNLPLPQLKWARKTTNAASKNSENNENPSQQPSQNPTKLARLESASAEQPKPSNAAVKEAKAADPGPPTEAKSTDQKAKSKFCIKLRTKASAPPVGGKPAPPAGDKAPLAPVVEEEEAEAEDETLSSIAALAAVLEEEEMMGPKTWNLRPRKPVLKPSGRASASRTGAALMQHSKPQAAASGAAEAAGGSSRAGGGGKGGQKKDNNRFKISVSLTKEEIEEDLFIMTGARPARRPQKRPKNVQKQLDYLFPGLYLNGVSRDSYEVPEPPIKRI